ncbi:MAG: hypothetical protein OEY43_10935 [Gammaproteobacteria bacterium]|nr:hypothetical protein [Gammaproteobacteria bacterium]
MSVLGVSILAVVLGVFLSSLDVERASHQVFPWQIEKLADGSTRVFQITLGQSHLADAEQIFSESAKITMFVPEQGEPVVEAYFNELQIAGLKAKLVVSVALTKDELQAIYDNGERISTMGSGTRKVTLHDSDSQKVRHSVISAMTYMPSINLDAEQITKRFGMPDEKINDTESDAEHWLYADRGLDILLSEKAKEVIQYVHPSDFYKLIEPLKK